MNLKMFTSMKSNVLITGGTSGIGRYFIEHYPYQVCNIPRDTDPESVIEQHVNDFGKINGFIHFAGVKINKPVQLFDVHEFTESMWANVGLAFHIIKYLCKKKYSDDLSIILFSSVAALKGEKCISQYAAAKGAIIGMTRALSKELDARVNCISPGIVSGTRMTDEAEDIGYKPESRFTGEKADVYGLLLYLLSDKAKWITGQNFVIDGGYTA